MRCSARILGTDTFSRLLDQIGRAHVRTPLTPRSTLFPYTTLFRSRIIIANGSLTLGNSWRNDALLGAYPGNRHIFAPSRPLRPSSFPAPDDDRSASALPLSTLNEPMICPLPPRIGSRMTGFMMARP